MVSSPNKFSEFILEKIEKGVKNNFMQKVTN